MRKRSKWAALAVVVALALAGCGSSETGSRSASAGGPKEGAATATGATSSSATTAGRAKGSRAKGVQGYLNKAPKYVSVPSSAPARSGVVKIAYRDFAIDPDTVKVKLGSTIEWINHDPAPQNVTGEGGPMKFASGNFKEGQTYSPKASKTGVIHYECTLEPTTMNGTIEVVR